MTEKWRNPEEWATLIEPDGCPICQSGMPWDVLIEFETTWVTGGPVAALPGYVCVIAKRHVVEPFDLPEAERMAFWEDAMRTARAVSAATGAVKLAYEIHGFTIPHLHMHILPRQADEPPPELRPAEYTRSPEELERLAEAIRRA